MSASTPPVTQAVRALRTAGVPFSTHSYRYEERGGTAVSARELGVDEHRVIKTLVMHDDQQRPLVVLMHGDLEVSTKNLARVLGCKSVTPCSPEVAERHSGYKVGGTSPFGLRKPLPIYVEQSILELKHIFINGGQRGFLVSLAPQVLTELLGARPVSVGLARS